MKLLSDVSKNARVCILIEPLWAVFGGLIFFYLPLYMKEIGLTEIQMGLINTLSMLLSFVCYFFAAPITNKLGRKKTSLIFDIISWSIPMLVWAIAQNFYYFLIAGLVNAFVRIVYISWTCLVSEDTSENKRYKVFAIINLLTFGAGVFTPVTGLLIGKYGVAPTMRVLYILGFASMTTMFILRNALVTETKAGIEIMEAHLGVSMIESIKKSLRTIRSVYKDKTVILLTLIYVLTSFIVSMNFYQILFLKEHLGFNAWQVSLTPSIGAVLNLLLFIFILPRIRQHNDEKLLVVSLVVGVAGALLFLLIPHGSMFLLLCSTSLLAISNYVVPTYRDSVFMNTVGEHEKADAFSAVQTITVLACIPSGYISGLLYSINPTFPFILILIMFFATLIISLNLYLHSKKVAIQGLSN